MKLSTNGLNLIKRFEGLRLKAYKVAGANEKEWTIGYGHYGVKQGAVITEAQATELLKRDVHAFELGVNNLLGNTKVNQNQFDALVSFAFNCGLGNLQKSTLLKLVKAKRFNEADDEFDKWVKAGGNVMGGLVRRRNAEEELFEKPMPKPPVVKKPVAPTPSKPKVVTSHTVKSGDTLSEIAKKYKTTVANLVKLNKIADKDEIKVGQKIKLK